MRGVAGVAFGLGDRVILSISAGLSAAAIEAREPRRRRSNALTIVCCTFLAVVFLSHLITPAKSQGREYSPLSQDDISGPITRAQAARRAGDCPLFLANLDQFETYIRNNRLSPTLLQRPTNTPEYQTYLRLRKESCPEQSATASGVTPEATEYVKLCGTGFFYIPGTNTCVPIRRGANPAGTEGVKVEVGGSAIASRVSGNVQRIARDFGGMIFYDLGNETQNGSGAGFNVGVRVPINTSFFGYKSYLNFAYNYLRLQGDGSGGQATTPTFILFPGLGVGTTPAGFAAGGTPFSYQYDFTQQRHGGEIAAGFEIERGPVEFYPWAGVRFASNSVEDTYTVSRPLPVPINATYMTDSNVNSLGIFVGLSVSVQPQGSPVEFFTQGRVGVDSNWAKSDVTFNIVFPGTNETQQVSLSDQKFTPYLFLETGVKVKVGAVQLAVSGFVEHGGYAPNISIPGGGASPVLHGETQTNYGGKVGLTGRF